MDRHGEIIKILERIGLDELIDRVSRELSDEAEDETEEVVNSWSEVEKIEEPNDEESSEDGSSGSDDSSDEGNSDDENVDESSGSDGESSSDESYESSSSSEDEGTEIEPKYYSRNICLPKVCIPPCSRVKCPLPKYHSPRDIECPPEPKCCERCPAGFELRRPIGCRGPIGPEGPGGGKPEADEKPATAGSAETSKEEFSNKRFRELIKARLREIEGCPIPSCGPEICPDSLLSNKPKQMPSTPKNTLVEEPKIVKPVRPPRSEVGTPVEPFRTVLREIPIIPEDIPSPPETKTVKKITTTSQISRLPSRLLSVWNGKIPDELVRTDRLLTRWVTYCPNISTKDYLEFKKFFKPRPKKDSKDLDDESEVFLNHMIFKTLAPHRLPEFLHFVDGLYWDHSNPVKCYKGLIMDSLYSVYYLFYLPKTNTFHAIDCLTLDDYELAIPVARPCKVSNKLCINFDDALCDDKELLKFKYLCKYKFAKYNIDVSKYIK